MLMNDRLGNPELYQFPHPTRPTGSFDMASTSHVPEERIPHHFHHSEVPHLPQSLKESKPINVISMSSVSGAAEDRHQHQIHDYKTSQHHQPSGSLHNHCTSSDTSVSSEDRLTQSTTATTTGEEAEAIDELVQILVECLEQVDTKNRGFLLRKFFSELEKETPLERFIIERLKHSKVQAISELLEKHPECLLGQVNSEEEKPQDSMQRDLNAGSMAKREFHGSVEEEFSHKLERFKVKTIFLGGLVKEEKK